MASPRANAAAHGRAGLRPGGAPRSDPIGISDIARARSVGGRRSGHARGRGVRPKSRHSRRRLEAKRETARSRGGRGSGRRGLRVLRLGCYCAGNSQVTRWTGKVKFVVWVAVSGSAGVVDGEGDLVIPVQRRVGLHPIGEVADAVHLGGAAARADDERRDSDGVGRPGRGELRAGSVGIGHADADLHERVLRIVGADELVRLIAVLEEEVDALHHRRLLHGDDHVEAAVRITAHQVDRQLDRLVRTDDDLVPGLLGVAVRIRRLHDHLVHARRQHGELVAERLPVERVVLLVALDEEVLARVEEVLDRDRGERATRRDRAVQGQVHTARLPGDGVGFTRAGPRSRAPATPERQRHHHCTQQYIFHICSPWLLAWAPPGRDAPCASVDPLEPHSGARPRAEKEMSHRDEFDGCFDALGLATMGSCPDGWVKHFDVYRRRQALVDEQRKVEARASARGGRPSRDVEPCWGRC